MLFSVAWEGDFKMIRIIKNIETKSLACLRCGGKLKKYGWGAWQFTAEQYGHDIAGRYDQYTDGLPPVKSETYGYGHDGTDRFCTNRCERKFARKNFVANLELKPYDKENDNSEKKWNTII